MSDLSLAVTGRTEENGVVTADVSLTVSPKVATVKVCRTMLSLNFKEYQTEWRAHLIKSACENFRVYLEQNLTQARIDAVLREVMK